MSKPEKSRDVTIENRKAFHDNEVLERYESGVELLGSEVKSVRDGKVNLTGGYAFHVKGEMVLRDVHIAPYEHGGRFNHEPTRQRRLLMHNHEIRAIADRAVQKGLALLPLKMYFNNKGWVKLELGLCRARKRSDKREVLKKKTADREAAQASRRAR